MNGKTKLILVLILLVIVIWGIYFLLGSKKESMPAAANKEIKIGFIGALTGEAAEYGEPQRNILQLGTEAINNAGGINGQPIMIIYEDGKCNGKDGASAAQKLINVDKVKVILGGSCSSETLAALPIIESEKAFIITGSATSPDLVNKSKFFARDYPHDGIQGVVLAEGASKRGWKKVAIMSEQTDYAQGIVKVFSARFAELGGTVIKEEFTTEATDFRSSLSKLKAAKPDALLLSTQTTGSGERVLKQIQELKWQPALMVNDVIGADQTSVEKNKTVLEGAIFGDFLLDTNNPQFQTLNAQYKERYGKEISFVNYAVAVYDSLYIVKDAIAAVGYDGEKIAEWIRLIKNWEGISGKITIGSDGERVSGHILKVIKDGKIEIAQ